MLSEKIPMTATMMKGRLEFHLERARWEILKRGTQSKPLIARQKASNRWHRDWAMLIKYQEPDARTIRLTVGVPAPLYCLQVEGEFDFHEEEFDQVVPLVIKALDGDIKPLNEVVIIPPGGWSEETGGNVWTRKADDAYMAQMVAKGHWPPRPQSAAEFNV